METAAGPDLEKRFPADMTDVYPDRPTNLLLKDTSKVFKAVARKHDAEEQCKLTPEQLLEIQIAGNYDVNEETHDAGGLSPTEIVAKKDSKQYYTLGSTENLDEFDRMMKNAEKENYQNLAGNECIQNLQTENAQISENIEKHKLPAINSSQAEQSEKFPPGMECKNMPESEMDNGDSSKNLSENTNTGDDENQIKLTLTSNVEPNRSETTVDTIKAAGNKTVSTTEVIDEVVKDVKAQSRDCVKNDLPTT